MGVARGRPPKPKNELRSKQIAASFTKDQAHKIQRLAEEAETTESDMLYRLAVQALNRKKHPDK